MSTHCSKNKIEYFGTATIGTKGQIVIPAKVRESLCMQPGDQFIVFGLGDSGLVGICQMSKLETIFSDATERLSSMQKMLEQVKEAKSNNLKKD